MSKCIQCGAEYEAKRADSRYCGPTCRSRASRGTIATDNKLSVAASDKAAIHATVATLTATDTQPLHAQQVDPQAILDDVGIVPAYVVPAMSPHILTGRDLLNWRGSRPYYLDQDTGLADMDDAKLMRILTGLNPWQHTAHYAERVYRLVHRLTSLSIPNNMIADGYTSLV